VLRTYTYVEGASLTGLLLEVRKEFWSRLPYELDDFRRPNSIRHVAIDVFEEQSTNGRLGVLHDLLVANEGLVVTAAPQAIFASADAPADYLVDIVCAIVQDVLERDSVVATENRRREALAAESRAVLHDEWRQAA
jgi:hypothetical protein